MSRICRLPGNVRSPAVLGLFLSVTTGNPVPPVLADPGRPRVGLALSGGLAADSLFLGADTPLGPVYLGLGQAGGGHRAAFFYQSGPTDEIPWCTTTVGWIKRRGSNIAYRWIRRCAP